jgi:hypothetical protein
LTTGAARTAIKKNDPPQTTICAIASRCPFAFYRRQRLDHDRPVSTGLAHQHQAQRVRGVERIVTGGNPYQWLAPDNPSPVSTAAGFTLGNDHVQQPRFMLGQQVNAPARRQLQLNTRVKPGEPGKELGQLGRYKIFRDAQTQDIDCRWRLQVTQEIFEVLHHPSRTQQQTFPLASQG